MTFISEIITFWVDLHISFTHSLSYQLSPASIGQETSHFQKHSIPLHFISTNKYQRKGRVTIPSNSQKQLVLFFVPTFGSNWPDKIMEWLFENVVMGVCVVAQSLMNLNRNRDVAGLIPGLAQWVEDPALL